MNDEQTEANYRRGKGAPITIRKDKKIGRNEPCKCGSGKKFKKCCLPKMKTN